MYKFYSEETKLTFDDVLIVPRHNTVKSREDTDISVEIKLPSSIACVKPVIPANMDTVSSVDLSMALGTEYLSILHRFADIDTIEQRFTTLHTSGIHTGVSLGLENGIEWADRLYSLGCEIFCIDVAHGHSAPVIKLVKELKAKYKCFVIAGNICTPQAAQDLYYAGADAVKIGIGPGSVCTTRLKTGCGYPQLSAILEIVVRRDTSYPDRLVIADGGMKSPGDIAKALAAGADLVMTGSMFAGCIECPGKGNVYRGMASKEAYKEHYGKELEEWKTAEGVSVTLLSKAKSAKHVVHDIEGGLRSALTYTGSYTLQEFKDNSLFIKVSPNVATKENIAHFNG